MYFYLCVRNKIYFKIIIFVPKIEKYLQQKWTIEIYVCLWYNNTNLGEAMKLVEFVEKTKINESVFIKEPCFFCTDNFVFIDSNINFIANMFDDA